MNLKRCLIFTLLDRYLNIFSYYPIFLFEFDYLKKMFYLTVSQLDLLAYISVFYSVRPLGICYFLLSHSWPRFLTLREIRSFNEIALTSLIRGLEIMARHHPLNVFIRLAGWNCWYLAFACEKTCLVLTGLIGCQSLSSVFTEKLTSINGIDQKSNVWVEETLKLVYPCASGSDHWSAFLTKFLAIWVLL